MPQERAQSPDLEALRPVLTVMSGIQARYVVDLRQGDGRPSLDLPARLALADARGTEAVAAQPANPTLAAEHATAFGAALWSALTALPDHSANEHRRLLKAAYTAHARLEAGEDGSGLAEALESTRAAAALAADGVTPAEEATASLADRLTSALGLVTAGTAVLDPSLTGE